MVGQSVLPSPFLREFVKSYQLWHFTFPNSTNLPFKPYAPRPEQTLVFCPRGCELVEYVSTVKIIKRPRSYIMGQYAERTNRHIGSADFITVIVNFQPGVLFRITGIPYSELTNGFVDAESVFSKEIRLVNEQLNSTNHYTEMIAIIENFLSYLLMKIRKDSHPVDAVANCIIEHPENHCLFELAKESFLCFRQFERKFKERMGVNPKLFTRIARMNKAFRTKYHKPSEDWLSIALACGYHDYQHLAKDFQDLASVNPNAYFLEDSTKAPETFFGVKDSSV